MNTYLIKKVVVFFHRIKRTEKVRLFVYNDVLGF